jgi:hypothetical protein
VCAASIIRAIIALMMEAARTSETSLNIQLRTRQYIPEDSEQRNKQYCKTNFRHKHEDRKSRRSGPWRLLKTKTSINKILRVAYWSEESTFSRY